MKKSLMKKSLTLLACLLCLCLLCACPAKPEGQTETTVPASAAGGETDRSPEQTPGQPGETAASGEAGRAETSAPQSGAPDPTGAGYTEALDSSEDVTAYPTVEQDSREDLP